MAEHARMSHDQHFKPAATKSGRSARTTSAPDDGTPPVSVLARERPGGR
jgi:hypothetical protein